MSKTRKIVQFSLTPDTLNKLREKITVLYDTGEMYVRWAHSDKWSTVSLPEDPPSEDILNKHQPPL